MKKIYYYDSFDDDMIENSGQDYELPPDYKWINDGKFHKIVFGILYVIWKMIARIYCRFFIHTEFIGRAGINKYKGKGCFVYANHTQPFGDAVIPTIAACKHRCAAIVSPSNLGIPVIGKLLPGIGAIPIPDDTKRMKEFVDTLKVLIDKGYCIFIYPEAHVWPYYTEIRPFSTSSFHYPVKFDAPVFSVTMTYQKALSGRPKAPCYIDKCNIPKQKDINKRKQIHMLHDMVYSTMKMRSKKSNFQYCQYIKMGGKKKKQ